MSILDIDGLEKRFGHVKVIDGLSFSVPEQCVFGFIGQNGAGKTTTMKMALGLLKPDAGRIHVCGEPVTFGRTQTNRHVGYLPDVPEFYGYMKPREYLRLCGEITGLPADRIRRRSDELLELVGLHKANKRIGGFSRGMKQRLGIAQALLNEPQLLICDEPTSALDPIGRKEILDIIHQVRGQSTVVFSTHILSDVERICDQIAVIDHGRIVLAGTLAELKAQHRQDSLAIDFAAPADRERFLALPETCELLARGDVRSSHASGGCPAATAASMVPTGPTVPTGPLVPALEERSPAASAGQAVPAITLNGTGLILQTRDIQGLAASILGSLARNSLLPVRFEILEPTIESLFLEAVQ